MEASQIQFAIRSLHACRAEEHAECRAVEPSEERGAQLITVCACGCHWRHWDRGALQRQQDGAWTWNGSTD